MYFSLNKVKLVFTLLCILVHTVGYGQVDSLKLSGTFSIEDKLTYKSIPFDVPEDIGILKILFVYDSDGNEIEIGVFDPNRFRGTSRFSKSSFQISVNFATPSYLYGPIVPGTWHVSLGFPVINQAGSFTVHITMVSKNDPIYVGPSNLNLNNTKGWYSGDFHTHTGHSDGFGCRDTKGQRTPCQVYQIAQSAHEAGLDFVAVADHNTISHFQDIETLQPTYPELLLLQSQEMTTFYGHAVLHGSREWIDFRLGSDGNGIQKVLEDSKTRGSLISIVHPGRETGDSCTGCGWSADSTDFEMVDAIEIVNGDEVETSISGIPFWHDLLDKGFQITGIGGSDDHSAGFGEIKPGTPTTVVWADGLSEFDILNGVRSGRVYLRTRREDGAQFKFYATSDNQVWEMGGIIDTESIDSVEYIVWMNELFHSVEIIVDGKSLDVTCRVVQTSTGYQCSINIKDHDFKWIRINIRDQMNNIRIISNPIYKSKNEQ